MKVIFLDIDGVLNSAVYDRTKSFEDGNIDRTRLPILRSIIDRTGADVVLSSSWRIHLDDDCQPYTPTGEGMMRIFHEGGIRISDKTPDGEKRADEIRAWLEAHTETEAFVILDDIFFGWGDLQENLVRTNYHIGRGLEQSHADKAVEILTGSTAFSTSDLIE